MATLILTTIGGAIGGPIGAMLGGIIGQSVDRELLFKPKGREGPRLTELALQTSSYGTPIPKLFGTLRVAGSVIWATDLIEHRHREGGKGRPTVTSYSYTASFAVALSARPILSVGRIWADGKLLRGAAGDWKANTGFRLHLGGEDQAADPLIASAEGTGSAPAHRGMAYAVFENLELADFGNRIPSLTFEVTADTGAVSAGAIVASVSGGAVAGGEAVTAIGGFSAYGGSQRGVIEPLVQATGAWPQTNGSELVLAAGGGEVVTVTDNGMRGAGTGNRAIAAADRAPRRVTLSHYDPARDYQAGLQSAVRPGAGHREAAIELPAVLSASEAKQLAEAALARADVERERRTVTTGWDALTIPPGGRVEIAGEPGQWRVASWSLEAMAVTLELIRIAPAALPASASPGRVLGAPDDVQGETIVHAFELPHLGEGLLASPRLMIAACGTEPAWRRAALALSVDGGVRWESAGVTAAPAVIGVVETPGGAADAAIEDRNGGLVVELAHDGMVLSDADDVGLDAGLNLALVGDELLQFGEAESLGDNRWRLTRLWRGRRGTEAAIGEAVAGDRFVLIDAATLAVRDAVGSVGATVSVLATGVGDPDGVEADAPLTGASVVPPCPVNLRAEMQADGAALLRWTRRSRAGWRWIDGVDAPLAEEAERYQLRITPGTMPEQTATTETPELLLGPEIVAAGPVVIEVRQAGDHGLSAPARLVLSTIEE
ncbi:phage tail protein [Sphingomonas sp. LT1P40]|uniref:phage tail protein n=1 Tax=Alteristakelama amylovorans TaxID=3096166 RepID=UPI002FC87C4B